MIRYFFKNLNDVNQQVAAQEYENNKRILQDNRITLRKLLEKLERP